MEYEATGERNGMEICFEPYKGLDFVDGLRVKVGSNPEKKLTGKGMHIYVCKGHMNVCLQR